MGKEGERKTERKEKFYKEMKTYISKKENYHLPHLINTSAGFLYNEKGLQLKEVQASHPFKEALGKTQRQQERPKHRHGENFSF